MFTFADFSIQQPSPGIPPVSLRSVTIGLMPRIGQVARFSVVYGCIPLSHASRPYEKKTRHHIAFSKLPRFYKRECKTSDDRDTAREARKPLFYQAFCARARRDERRGRGPGFSSFLYARIAAAPWHFLYFVTRGESQAVAPGAVIA